MVKVYDTGKIVKKDYQQDNSKTCFDQMQEADIVFAWVDNVDCPEVLVEIGIAKGLSKPIFLAMPIGFSGYKDMWFASSNADMSIMASDQKQARDIFESVVPKLVGANRRIEQPTVIKLEMAKCDGKAESKIKSTILEMYGDGKPFTRKEVMALTGISNSFVSRMLNMMVAKGYLRSKGYTKNKTFIVTTQDTVKKVTTKTDNIQVCKSSIEEFIISQCFVERDAVVSKAELYDKYRNYCFANGLSVVSQICFNSELQKITPNIAEFKNGMRYWRGIGLSAQNSVKATESETCSDELTYSVTKNGLVENLKIKSEKGD